MSDTIDVDSLAHDASNLRIIDIRKRPDERQIPGSQRYDGEALSNAEFLPFKHDDKIVVYCGSGNSCSVLAEELRDRGYDARALEGGYRKWKEAGLPTEPLSKETQF
ncbi:MAG TPA: rhodanese-like domain-containing protein [Candidatus Baltobacteraceae bacterium]|jgi:rhodanese-related sulfurtransferase|nr:rhodanese-like domain-containing protein [Candidatus Baltobacteraceae bacterium]